MKKLLILPLLVLLTGCVTYYYPETALDDGVYYAEDDPSYFVYSDSYADTVFYPWSSLDYFYLGYNPYPRYGFGSGFSFGIGYGYSPWYYPYSYYGYYSPWYASHSHYPYYPTWRPYSGYCSRHSNCSNRYRNNHRVDRQGRYAGNSLDGRRNRSGEYLDDIKKPADQRRNEGTGKRSNRAAPVRRYVSTAPAGHSGDRGMVIRSRESSKAGKIRLHPDKSTPVSGVRVAPAGSVAGAAVKATPNTVAKPRTTSRTSNRSRPATRARKSEKRTSKRHKDRD